MKIVYLVSFFVLFSVFTVAGKEVSNCVKCHTSSETLKSLVIVPKLSEEAGGG